ncbi:biliverdin-producing heme oxygenase [Jatrophihabitans endophyticus]|uniref:biliverdin-producing heme oxygenase n=1 Tax=Jatrophihabitans endophyticus TaxID=1206085 RepID=UPI0019FA7D19|nr:biliverdin-producing heme oxygenase [Jatrophihabitans endophyticus]MBE7188218.1 biliverdin-producing heme oxygenase [Jatrophihabitans endophyticus]
MEADLSTAARLLKQQTADSHRRVEQQLDLARSITPARMLDVLQRLGGFWAAEEPHLHAWFAAHPAAAEALQWSRRARLAAVRADLVAVSAAAGVPTPELVAAPRVFTDLDEAAVLGWLYVTEGSTLGGAVIDRMLRDAGFPCRLGTFAAYPEGPQPMWRAYLAHLEAWTSASDARVELVVAAGVTTFAALEQWVDAFSPSADVSVPA